MFNDTIQIKIVTENEKHRALRDEIENLENEIIRLKEKAIRRLNIPRLKDKLSFLESLTLVTNIEEVKRITKEAEEQFELKDGLKESIYYIPKTTGEQDYAFYKPSELTQTIKELKSELEYLGDN